MVPSFEVSRYNVDNENFTKTCKEAGFDVIVADAKNNDQDQLRQANELMDKGAKVLAVIAVNQVTAASIVREAHLRNVKVIAYSRLIKNSDLDYFIGFEELSIGEQMAQYAIKLKPEGNYIIINGDKRDHSAVLCQNGEMNVLQPYLQSGKIKILYNCYIEDWSKAEAEIVVKNILKLRQEPVDAVLVGNDGMASSVIKVLAEQRLNRDAVITGLDAELQACKNIQTGKQAMTVYMPIKLLACKAAQIAISFAKKELIQNDTAINNGRIEVPATLFKTIPVDQSNMRTTVIEDGLYKESDIY